jgi:tripartite-type tricarboxylate transporter receptor subunit TctC
VMGGHVQMMFDAVTSMKGIIEGNQVRALATTGLVRSTVMPNLPTVAEAGVPGYDATIWLGVMAPKGTPREIVDRLNAEIVKIIDKPAIKEAWAKQGAVPITMTPDAFGAFLKGDIEKWAKVIDKAGLKPQ